MKLSASFLSIVSLPLVLASVDHRQLARQLSAAGAAAAASSAAPAAAKSSAAPAAPAASAPAATPAAPGAPAVTAAPASSAPPATLPAGWLSTDANAVPLASINSAAAAAPTQPVPAPTAAGTKPTYIANAPGLPDASQIVPANYPVLDKTPPIDSPEVQQWIQDVANSGVDIPNITPTVLGGCPANAAAAADQSRCWWTCGGCTNGTDVTTCPTKFNWGLTYDDGPASYTPDLLNYLDTHNIKATFFVVGSRAISYPGLLQKEYLDGHEIAVHTWAHPYLTTLSNEQIIAEFGWTKKIIQDVLGVTPLYFRPPYGDIDNRVRAIAKAMNLIPVMWTRISPTATFDTADFNLHGGTSTISQVLTNWEGILANASTINTGFIVLEHDLFQQTVEVATGYILPDALAFQPKLTIEPVGTCLGLKPGDFYIETNDNSTHPIPNPNPPVAASSGGSKGSKGSSTAGSNASGGDGSSSAASHSLHVVGSGAVLALSALLSAALFV